MAETRAAVHPGRIEASADERAVLLHVQIVESERHASGEWEVVRRADNTRKLRIVEPLTADTDVVALARKMYAGCKFIKEAALPQVEDALRVLQKRDMKPAGAFHRR